MDDDHHFSGVGGVDCSKPMLRDEMKSEMNNLHANFYSTVTPVTRDVDVM